MTKSDKPSVYTHDEALGFFAAVLDPERDDFEALLQAMDERITALTSIAYDSGYDDGEAAGYDYGYDDGLRDVFAGV
jgi:hypothetical protein